MKQAVQTVEEEHWWQFEGQTLLRAREVEVEDRLL